jgi:large subunit ribosomal protein L25
MEALQLNAKRREVIGKQVRALRRDGLIPAILYGTGIKPISLKLVERETSRALSRIGSATLIDLKVGKTTHKVLVREMQRDIISNEILHIDFLKVAMDVVIRTIVPLDLIGEAPAVKDEGGILITGLTEIEVEALPSNLPEYLKVDLSVLENLEDKISVGDIILGEGVKLLTSLEEMVVQIIIPAEEVEEEEEVEVEEEALISTAEEPEVIERGKREEEEVALSLLRG